MALTKVSYSMITGTPANIMDFGAVGDGITDDSDAVIAAFAASDCVFFPNKTFYLGTVTDANNILIDLTDKDGLQIVSDNATLTAAIGTLTSSTYYTCFGLVDCSNVSFIGNLNIEFTGSKVYEGPDGIRIDAKNSTSENIYIQQINTTNAAATVRSSYGTQAAPFSNRVQSLVIDSLVSNDTHYGYLGEQNGDNVVITSLTTYGATRSLYVQGVDNVVANVTSYDHIQASADVLIATYYRNTTNIKVRYFPINNQSTESLVRVVHYATTGSNPVTGPTSGKLIDNIDIYADDSQSTVGIQYIYLLEEDTAGTVRTTSPHIMQNIKIAGKATRYNGNAPDAIVATPTAFAEPGRLYIDNSFFDYYAPLVSSVSAPMSITEWLKLNPIQNWQIHMGGNRWAAAIIGNLETQTLKWDMRENWLSTCVAKVSLMVMPDYTKTVGGGGMAAKYFEYSVFGSIASSGYYTYGSAALLSSGAYGGYAPTVTFSGSGTTTYLTCTLTSANGATPANGRAVGIVEFF